MRSVGRDLLFTMIGFLAALFLMGGLGFFLVMQERSRSEALMEEVMEMERATRQQADMARQQAEAAAEAARQEVERTRKALEEVEKK